MPYFVVLIARTAISTALAAVRFHTVTEKPAASSLRAMGAPISPVPSTAIFMSFTQMPSARGNWTSPAPQTGQNRTSAPLKISQVVIQVIPSARAAAT